MKVVKFKKNWNGKLYGESYFTTIRRDSDYYMVGDKYQVLLDGEHVEYAILEQKLGARHFVHEGVMTPLGWAVLALDTGYTEEKALKLFSNFGVDILKDEWALLLLRWDNGED